MGTICSLLPCCLKHWELLDGTAYNSLYLQPCCYSSWRCWTQALLLAFTDRLQIPPPFHSVRGFASLWIAHSHIGRKSEALGRLDCVWLELPPSLWWPPMVKRLPAARHQWSSLHAQSSKLSSFLPRSLLLEFRDMLWILMTHKSAPASSLLLW